jgi:serine/tyrosine/threonine adenylyltransferase
MSILGLTIDYGPFQFMDAFDPGHVCNHSDSEGRYAFDQQPDIAHWNLFCLGQALLPLIVEQPLALKALQVFKPVFQATLHQLMCAKLGLIDHNEASVATDAALIADLLKLLAQDRVDYTIFWRRLSQAQAETAVAPVRDLFLDREGFDRWMLHYSERIAHIEKGLQVDLMLKSNPKYVLRNHLGEEAIRAAKVKNFDPVADVQKVLAAPYDEHPAFERWADFPPDWAGNISISCSS